MMVGRIKNPFDESHCPPAITLQLLLEFAWSMKLLILVNDFSSMTAFTKLVKSSAQPIFRPLVIATSFSLTCGQRLFGI